MNDEQALFIHLRVNRAKASRNDFAKAIGVNPSTISRLEGGTRTAGFSIIVSLRKVMLSLVDDFEDSEMFDFETAHKSLAEAALEGASE